MRYVSRAAGFPARMARLPAGVDWRKPENLVRLGILTVVIAALVALDHKLIAAAALQLIVAWAADENVVGHAPGEQVVLVATDQ